MSNEAKVVDVQVGSLWRDLDKRMHCRIVKITRVADGRAYYGKNGNGPSISITRLRRPFWEPASAQPEPDSRSTYDQTKDALANLMGGRW